MKAFLAPLVREIAHRTGYSRRTGLRDPRMRVLKLHGVGHPDYPATVFRRQMAWLKANFELATLDAVVAALPDPPPVGKPWVALTFDDGLRNFATVVHPVLCELEIPAVVYVCPSLVEEGRWLWNQESLARLRTIPPGELAGFLGEIGEAPANPRAIVDRMKRMPCERRMAVAAAIRGRTPRFRATADEREAFDLMSWEELASLSARWVTIGSHTLTHPLLPYLDAAEMASEIKESRRRLELRLDREILHFAYPSGAADERAAALVRETYRSACTSEPGFLETGDDPILLKRVSMPRTLAGMSWELCRPGA